MAKTLRITDVIDGEPCFDAPIEELWQVCKKGGAIKVLDPLEYHTDRQRRWYKGVCLKGLSDWSGETSEWWDRELKKHCFGDELLKREEWLTMKGQPVSRLTVVGVGKKNMTAFIENILSKSIEMEWPVTAPDPELRKI